MFASVELFCETVWLWLEHVASLLFCFFLSAVTEAGKAGDSLAVDFFREEYMLNNLIGKRYKYNYTCIINYICYVWVHIHLKSHFISKHQASTLSVCIKVSFPLFLHILLYLLRILQKTIYCPYWWNNNGRGEYIYFWFIKMYIIRLYYSLFLDIIVCILRHWKYVIFILVLRIKGSGFIWAVWFLPE